MSLAHHNQVFIKRLKLFSHTLPKFSDGRIDYSNADAALVVVCFIKFRDTILLLKRSDKVRTYKGKWNTVAGYLDEFKPIKEKVLEEVNEEISVSAHEIKSLKIGDVYEFFDPHIKKTWIVHPFLAELKRLPSINLDFEHTEYVWIKPDEMQNYDIVPNLMMSWEKIK